MSDLNLIPGSGDYYPGDSPRRRRRSTPQRRRRTTTAGVLIASLAVLGVGGAVTYQYLGPHIQSLLGTNDYDGPGSGEVAFEVTQGMSTSKMRQALVDAKVIKSTEAYSNAARDLEKDPVIQQGVYLLKREMKAADALAILSNPKNRQVKKVTVPEGLRLSDLYKRVAEQTGVPVGDYEAAVKSGAVKLPREANGNPEGFLFPSTYELKPNSKPADLLNEMVQQYEKTMNVIGVPADRRRDVVIKASIAQAEGRNVDEFGKITRVIETRLQKKMPLGMDSTINYLSGKSKFSTSAEDRKRDHPYNTYERQGLPPGPISHPGADALRAAYQPPAGNWLYFCTVNSKTGETWFSKDAAEHRKCEEEMRRVKP